MKTVGIKQLKARLSEYVRAVRAGETVLVTHHDQVVAELCPPRRPVGSNRLEKRLNALARAGTLTPAPLPKRDWSWQAAGLGLQEGTATALLDELRAER